MKCDFAIGIGATGWLWGFLSLPLALVILGPFLVALQADFTSYSVGANDNATSAGVVLSVAQRLSAEPLIHTAVWAVLFGCEEVGCHGANAFAQAYGDELGRAVWIALEVVGGTGACPAYLTHETLLLTYRSDPELLALADQGSSHHPEPGAHRFAFFGAYTEGTIGAKYGFRVLTLLGLRRDGVLSEWHRPTDVMANVGPGAVERTETCLWELLQGLDKQAREGASAS